MAKLQLEGRSIPKSEWSLYTTGNNFYGVLGIKGIDSQRTISNDVREICEVLGIEAAKTFYVEEFTKVVKGSGISVNMVHINTLVDRMTYTGEIRAISRFGTEVSQSNPFTRISFEEPLPQVITSAIFSEYDRLNGISSNIVLGKKINAGTGMAKITNIDVDTEEFADVDENDDQNWWKQNNTPVAATFTA